MSPAPFTPSECEATLTRQLLVLLQPSSLAHVEADTEALHMELFLGGLAALLLFMQLNWTGTAEYTHLFGYCNLYFISVPCTCLCMYMREFDMSPSGPIPKDATDFLSRQLPTVSPALLSAIQLQSLIDLRRSGEEVMMFVFSVALHHSCMIFSSCSCGFLSTGSCLRSIL
jgi:hypothetical protein